LAAKSDLVANNPSISTKVSLPKVMAKDDGIGSAGAILVIGKTAAQEKLDAQSAEKLRTDPQGMKPLWLSRVGEVDAQILPRKLKLSLKYSQARTFLSDLEILIRTIFGLKSPAAN